MTKFDECSSFIRNKNATEVRSVDKFFLWANLFFTENFLFRKVAVSLLFFFVVNVLVTETHGTIFIENGFQTEFNARCNCSVIKTLSYNRTSIDTLKRAGEFDNDTLEWHEECKKLSQDKGWRDATEIFVILCIFAILCFPFAMWNEQFNDRLDKRSEKKRFRDN